MLSCGGSPPTALPFSFERHILVLFIYPFITYIDVSVFGVASIDVWYLSEHRFWPHHISYVPDDGRRIRHVADDAVPSFSACVCCSFAQCVSIFSSGDLLTLYVVVAIPLFVSFQHIENMHAVSLPSIPLSLLPSVKIYRQCLTDALKIDWKAPYFHRLKFVLSSCKNSAPNVVMLPQDRRLIFVASPLPLNYPKCPMIATAELKKIRKIVKSVITVQ